MEVLLQQSEVVQLTLVHPQEALEGPGSNALLLATLLLLVLQLMHLSPGEGVPREDDDEDQQYQINLLQVGF